MRPNPPRPSGSGPMYNSGRSPFCASRGSADEQIGGSLEATFMLNSSWAVNLEQAQTSYMLLAALAATATVAGILFKIGWVGWVLRGIGIIVRGGVRGGF